jgi:hypothetical protein
MVSKEISEKIPSRVPETRIVGPSRFRKPIDVPPAQSLVGSPSPYSSSLITVTEEDSKVPPEAVKKDEIVTETIDVPSLSDIEDIDYVEYKNKEGVTKIKVLIKIRNSSINKQNVKGVDGRIPPVGE